MRMSHIRSAHGGLQLAAARVRDGLPLAPIDRYSLAMIRAYAEHMLEGRSLDPADVYTTAVQWAAYPKENAA